MSRILSRYTILILVLTITSITAYSQSVAAIPAAPIPAQMVTGKNVFIANLTGEDDAFMSVAEQPYYNAFYNAIKNGGQYHLVSTPEEADLVFQLRTIKGGVEVIIIDPHSNIALWAISREVMIGGSLSALQKSLTSATVTLASDLQKLTASAAPSSTQAK